MALERLQSYQRNVEESLTSLQSKLRSGKLWGWFDNEMLNVVQCPQVCMCMIDTFSLRFILLQHFIVFSHNRNTLSNNFYPHDLWMNVCKVEHNQFAEWILIPPGLYQSLLWIYWKLLFRRLPFFFFLSQPCCCMVWPQQPSSPWPCLFFFLCYHLVIRSGTKKAACLRTLLISFTGK